MEFASSKPVCTSPVEDIDTTAPPGGTTALLPPPVRQVFFTCFKTKNWFRIALFFANAFEILKCFCAWTTAQESSRMHLSHLRAPALVHRPSSSNNNSKEFQSINRSLSLVCRQIYPCTPPHDTSQRRSCGCWRAVCTAGGARWRTTPGVQTHMHASICLHWYWYISVSCSFGLCTFTCFCLVCVRSAGQYI